MEAKASRTLRKYGCCQADIWTTEDAGIAGELLHCLEVEGKMQAQAQGLAGDKNAWLWPRQEPPIMALMLRAVSEVSSVGVERQAQVEAVAQRLMGPYHLPAVKEALGCLIPASLHPDLDGTKPKGRAQAGGGPGGVCLKAGQWQVDVGQERGLYGSVALSKGMLEFFLIVLRRVCEELRLSVLVGTHAVVSGANGRRVMNEF